jgi:signal transduction histidine kinase
MKSATIPENERERLTALEKYNILDTPKEGSFDDLTQLASELCGTPIALMSLIDAERQWFKSSVGLPTPETHRNVAFCSHAILGDNLFIVPDTLTDERFMDNPLVTSDPHIRFYAGAPLQTPEGLKLGTLCVIDRVPRQLTSFQKSALQVLAKQVEAQLELRLKLKELTKKETEVRAQRDALTRLQHQKEELIEFVVHDLKNPLMVILSNAQFLADGVSSDDVPLVARDIAISADIMHRMVLNLLDISRGEEGILRLKRTKIDIAQIISEVAASETHRGYELAREVMTSVSSECGAILADQELLRRMLENLVDNSFKYAPSGKPVQISTRLVENTIELRVCDEGPGIPAAFREKIFEKYAQLERDVSTHARSSRGLGLVFCRLVAEAHGGRIWVEDNLPRGSAFIVSLPLMNRAANS